MNCIYIDANIYLGFYNSNRPEFKKLLASLSELKDKIFITEQIVDEVDRNKLTVFKQSLDNYVKQTTFINISLPEHMDEISTPKLSTWNKTRKELESKVAESNEALRPILAEVLLDVSRSKDNVSLLLGKLFTVAVKPTEIELARARLRKDTGNPPGKRVDPLGDQLSWEQLLTRVEDIKKLWIVSMDRDYFTEHDKQLYLNSLLHQDLFRLNPTLQVKIFSTLSAALSDFSKEEVVTTMPSKKELEEILSKEFFYEKLNAFFPTASLGVPYHCPRCDAEFSFKTDKNQLRDSALGQEYICSSCGYVWNTNKW